MTQQILDSTPMIDIQAELSTLGSVFLDSSVIDEISFLEERDFSTTMHQLIYKVMRYLNERDIPIDLVTVTQEFMKFGRTEEMGGVSYLAKLAQSSPTAKNAAYYANIVRSKAIRRRGSDKGAQIMNLTYGNFESDEDYFSAVEDIIDDLRPSHVAKMRSMRESRDRYFEHIESSPEKLKTGYFKQFDSWSQLWRGWLYIIAGRPSVGKTAKALQLAHGIAVMNPDAGPVLIFSQEMDENELKDRIVAMVAEINYPRLINKGGPEGFTNEEWTKIYDAYRKIELLNIFVQDSAGVTIDEIRSTVKQFKKKYGKIAAVIVDYLQIMEIPQKRSETRAQAIGNVTRTAKSLARRHKFVFIMLSQLDRAVDDEEPKLKHLKESGSIEQDADVVEFLYHDVKNQSDPTKKIIDSIFAKGRNVGTNRFRYEFKWWHQRYVELQKRETVKDNGGKGSRTNRK
ncbi:Replicative DNA helicase [compost metagenome]